MNALCVVGEWRTFAMPAVHLSIVKAAKVWNADAFMFYHTRYDGKAMAHGHRDNAEACAFNSSLLTIFKTAEEVAPPCPNKEWKASVQFRQISACFSHAMRTGQSYRWFIRSRPDYLIHNPKPLPTDATRILVGYPKPDMLFAIPSQRINAWFHGMPNSCQPGCCIEYIHRMFKLAPPAPRRDAAASAGRDNKTVVRWLQDGAIVRGTHRLAWKTMWRPDADTISRLTCNITGHPKRDNITRHPKRDSRALSNVMSTRRQKNGIRM